LRINTVASEASVAELPHELFRKWGHSFEESTGEITVYRTAEYEFPRARGRASLEFKPDGTFIYWAIGPADNRLGINGHWKIESPVRVSIVFEGNVRAPLVMEILQCNAKTLRVRQRPASL
jgi:hypothetical protein